LYQKKVIEIFFSGKTLEKIEKLISAKSLTTTPISSTQMTTRLKVVTKKKLQLTTVKLTTTLPLTTNVISANASVDQT
jgi:hypothetical protein